MLTGRDGTGRDEEIFDGTGRDGPKILKTGRDGPTILKTGRDGPKSQRDWTCFFLFSAAYIIFFLGRILIFS